MRRDTLKFFDPRTKVAPDSPTPLHLHCMHAPPYYVDHGCDGGGYGCWADEEGLRGCLVSSKIRHIHEVLNINKK
jgi:hypothetical protein